MIRRFGLVFALCHFIGLQCWAAEFKRSNDSTKDYLRIDMTGPIDPGDLFKLMSALNEVSYDKSDQVKTAIVFFDSTGGDVKEALTIGRYLHAQRIRSGIAKYAKCTSACAYAFLGGTQRKSALAHRQKSTDGILAFHAFRMSTTDASYMAEDMKKNVKLAQEQMFDLVNYFIEVDGDPRLLNLAVQTDPPSLRQISNSEAIDFCIFVWNEKAEAKYNPVNPYKIRETTGNEEDTSWRRSHCKNP
jgi:hypothetical protein